MLDINTACLCLHNLCILDDDEFFMDWIEEVEKELQAKANISLGKMQQVYMDTLRIVIEGNKGDAKNKSTSRRNFTYKTRK